MHWVIHRTVAVVLGSVMLAALAGSARAQAAHTERRVRIVDVGFRPLVSMPDALGLTAEVHLFGGNLALEGGVGMSPVVAFTWTAAVKYRFVVYTGEQVQLSVGPGVGSHWLFERGSPIDQQLLSAFATLEAVWWKWWDDRIGFRLAMDAGVMHPIYDAPEGSNLGTTPVFNGSIGWAFRLGR
jgi:hypothetical protein